MTARQNPRAGSAAAIFRAATDQLEAYLRRFEAEIPGPVTVASEGMLLRRYRDQSPQQALVLKYAGYLSGLNAIDALLAANLVYEIVAIQRGLDEMLDEIALIAGAPESGQGLDLRERFLADFWHDPNSRKQVPGTKSPKVPTRKEIREAVRQIFGLSEDFNVAGNTLYKFGSRSAHSTAAPLLDLASPLDGRLQVAGMFHTGIFQSYIRYAWNSFYRGYLAAQTVAIGLRMRAFGAEIGSEGERFARSSGTLSNL